MKNYVLYVWSVEPSGTELPDKVKLLVKAESQDRGFLSDVYNGLAANTLIRLQLSEVKTLEECLNFRASSLDSKYKFKN